MTRTSGSIGFSRAAAALWAAASIAGYDPTYGAIKPLIPVTGLIADSAAADEANHQKIMDAVAKAKASGGAFGILIPASGGVVHVSDAIQFDYHGAHCEYDTAMKLTKTSVSEYSPLIAGNATTKTNTSLFEFSGFVSGSGAKWYLQRPVLKARRPGLWLDGNGAAIKTAGFTYVTGNAPSPLVKFLGCTDYLLEDVWTTNTICDGIVPAYGRGVVRRCWGNGTFYDNGIYVLMNNEHIVALDENDPDTWSGTILDNCIGSDCHNHGLGVWGALGVTAINPRWWNCGNDLGIQGGGGGVGGFGLEYGPGTSALDHHFLMIGGHGRDCYGYTFRTNVKGVRMASRPKIGGGKKFTNWARATVSISGDQMTVESINSQGSGWGGIIDDMWLQDTTGGIAFTIDARVVNQVSGTPGGAGVYRISEGGFSVSHDTVDFGCYDSTTQPRYGCSIYLQGAATENDLDVDLTLPSQLAAIVAGGAAETGYPSARINARIKGHPQVLRGYGIGHIHFTADCEFLGNGYPAVTSQDVNTAAIYVTNQSNNQDGGSLRIQGRWKDNYGHIATYEYVGEVEASNISGDNNQRAYSAGTVMFRTNNNMALLRAANILLTNGASGKCSIAFNCPSNVTTLIADFKSIIAPQSTAAKAPIAVTGTVTNRYADRYEALGGVAPTSVPTYVGQELIDSSGSKVYKAKGYTSSADWVALN